MKYRTKWISRFPHVLEFQECGEGAFKITLQMVIPDPNKAGMYARTKNVVQPYLEEVLDGFTSESYRVDPRRRQVAFRNKADALMFRLAWRPEK